MESTDKKIHRPGLFIVAYQLEGVCNGLRLAISSGRSPANGTIQILTKLRSDLDNIIDGGVLMNLPRTTDLAEAVDILVYAETLRSSVLVFLTPQEIAEHQKTIGFK